MLQTKPSENEKYHDHITRPSKGRGITFSTFTHLCCIGVMSKLIPEPNKFNSNNTDITNENALSCKCDEESVLTKASHGDLYYIGLLWISAVKTALIGYDVFPAIVAAPPPPPPEKPPKMPFKELPLYDSPHKNYREAKEAAKPVCPEANEKLLQNYLLPTVGTYRKKVSDVYYQNKCVARNFLIDQGKIVEQKYTDFVNYMRDPENFPYRVGAVALTSLLGLRLGWRGGIPRKVFFTGLGALAGGALAFPTETDHAFRNVAFHTGNALLSFYNLFTGTCESMPESRPCKDPAKRLVCDSNESIIPSKQPCPMDPPKK